MNTFRLLPILMTGCFVAPELIEPGGSGSLDAGAGTDAGAWADGGRETDAGASTWTLTPPMDALLGADADQAPERPELQIDCLVAGEPSTEFGLYEGETLLGAGSTDAQGTASVRVTLTHGVHSVSLRTTQTVLERTWSVDTTPPTFEVETSAQATRLPLISWGALSDDDGVGAQDVAAFELSINGDDFAPVSERVSDQAAANGSETGRLRGLPSGDHELTFRATDEVGNTTERALTLTVALDVYTVSSSNTYVNNSKPCAGDLDADGLDEVVIIRTYMFNGIALNSGIVFWGSPSFGDSRITTFDLGGQGANLCLAAPLRDTASDQLAVVSSGPEGGRIEFVEWWARAQEIRTFHVMNPGARLMGSVMRNLAYHPRGLAPGEVDETAQPALALQVGSRFIKMFPFRRLEADSPSAVDDDAPNSVTLQTPNSLSSGTLITGSFRQPGQAGVAVVDRRGSQDRGVVWVLDTPLETEMSYVLSDQEGEGPMALALRGASEDVMGSLATTIRFGEGLVDGVLTTTDGGDQLIIHRRGAEAEVIEPPASVQALNDLAACDLNGDGRDEISVVGRTRHYIRWGTGEWTQSPVSERPVRTQCASDINRDGLNDLILTTASQNSVYILH